MRWRRWGISFFDWPEITVGIPSRNLMIRVFFPFSLLCSNLLWHDLRRWRWSKVLSRRIRKPTEKAAPEILLFLKLESKANESFLLLQKTLIGRTAPVLKALRRITFDDAGSGIIDIDSSSECHSVVRCTLMLWWRSRLRNSVD